MPTSIVVVQERTSIATAASCPSTAPRSTSWKRSSCLSAFENTSSDCAALSWAVCSAATMDIGEFLLKEKAAGRLDTNFTVPQGSIAYHIPCHLRAQKIGQPFRTILAGVPGTTVEPIEQCSAFDGTWGMKTEYYETSRRCAGKLCGAIRSAEAGRVISDCMLAGLNVAEETGTAPSHPIEVLRDAYGLVVNC